MSFAFRPIDLIFGDNKTCYIALSGVIFSETLQFPNSIQAWFERSYSGAI
jgi:hypothetical protein